MRPGQVDEGPAAPLSGARLVTLHVSMMRALGALGVPDNDAEVMVRAAKAAGRQWVQLHRVSADAAPLPYTIILRRMRGGHVEEWRRHPPA